MTVRQLINEVINPYLIGEIEICDDVGDLRYKGNPDKNKPINDILNSSIKCIYPINNGLGIEFKF